MHPDRWRRIDEIFHAAVKQPPAQRAGFLDEVCADDPEIRADVDRLLAFDDEKPSFIDVPVVEASSLIPDPRLGNTIGVYRLVERIAAGGMGIVYRAQRTDGLFDVPVALKIVRREMDSDDMLRRFQIERRTLAGLSHPNIARLLDGGLADDGLPYLVMEFVPGQTITEFCDERRLTVRQRLELFCAVCRAVHYAHQNLVVHRDLKPGNILVGSDGVPKLLDFGLAKLLDPDGGEPVGHRTATAARMLTPDYSSPEQIRGEPVSTASDIYSLGVVLYALLTGRRPYRLTSARLDDIERAVCDQDPTRPSVVFGGGSRESGAHGRGDDPAIRSPRRAAALRGTVPERLRRSLKGDLDVIVMTAMQKDPARRYASVEQFAADIERYLHGLPIVARKDTLTYRSLKFVRRNRVGVAGAALIFTAITLSAIIAIHLARVAERDRDAAEHEARHARIESDSANEVAEIIGRAFLSAASAGSNGDLVEGVPVLEREIERVRRQYAHRRHLQANLLDAIGRTMLDLHRYESAESLFEEALSLRVEEFGDASLEVARSYGSMGRLRLETGDTKRAETAFRHALDLHRNLPVGVHTDVARAANDLGVALQRLGRLDEAEGLHEEALALRRRHPSADDTRIAECLEHLARIDLDRADGRHAQARLHEVLDIRRGLLGPDHPLVAEALRNLAVAVHVSGDAAAAIPLFEEAVTALRSERGSDEIGLARTLTSLAAALCDVGDSGRAEEHLREALEIYEQTLPDGHWRRGAAHTALGVCLANRGRWEEATPRVLEGLRVTRDARGDAAAETARARAAVRRVFEAQGRPMPVGTP